MTEPSPQMVLEIRWPGVSQREEIVVGELVSVDGVPYTPQSGLDALEGHLQQIHNALAEHDGRLNEQRDLLNAFVTAQSSQ